MAGIVAGVERGGGRSSGINGVGAAGLREASEVVLRAPGDSVSTVTRSVAAIGVGGHGGDMAGGAKLPAVMANRVRGQLK